MAKHMLKLLERAINSLDDRLVLLAPNAAVSGLFQNIETDSRQHAQLVREMQTLRGSVYLQEGAIGRDELSAEGLHETAEDERSWHLLTLDKNRRVSGCIWYLEHDTDVSVDQLRVRHTPLARSGWREKLWSGVEAEVARARRFGLNYIEAGGWAVSPESRCTTDGLVLAIGSFSLARLRGDCLGITTATVRHCSSSILRRLGGAPLKADEAILPRYYDPRYSCDMEILRFDSRYPGKRYAGLVKLLQQKLSEIQLIAPAVSSPLVAGVRAMSAASGAWSDGWGEHAVAQPAFAR
jgi:hypothetical protein